MSNNDLTKHLSSAVCQDGTILTFERQLKTTIQTWSDNCSSYSTTSIKLASQNKYDAIKWKTEATGGKCHKQVPKISHGVRIRKLLQKRLCDRQNLVLLSSFALMCGNDSSYLRNAVTCAESINLHQPPNAHPYLAKINYSAKILLKYGK